ncbi:hypothetical protein [Rhizobium sp. S152]|uniref:hypothetical protein n=1 Tax=Rhizobium sp. S152 TaxID=3055038 RepID=UPI0025A9A56C|nr:hypothetical protein [Rhizobium sp. S152]
MSKNPPGGNETAANVFAWFGDDRQTKSVFDAGLAIWQTIRVEDVASQSLLSDRLQEGIDQIAGCLKDVGI